MKAWVVAAVATASACMSPVMHFGGGKSAQESQHDTLGELMPATLVMEGGFRPPYRDATVRVYGDDDYRAQNLHWQQTFGEQLEYANAVLGPQFGIHLVADYREWNHHAPGNGLPDDLDELKMLDAGADVVSVVGLTSSLSLASATFDLLGYASIGGRHIMLRGYADLEERKVFARAFPDLPADERERALEARRRHKTAAVVLHELGHNFGAEHVVGDTLMNPVYSEHAAAFSDDSHAAVQRGIDERLGRKHRTLEPLPPPVAHPTLFVHVTAASALIDGDAASDSELSTRFGEAAAADKDTEVIFQKDKGVPSSRLIELIDRAKAAGLARFSMR